MCFDQALGKVRINDQNRNQDEKRRFPATIKSNAVSSSPEECEASVNSESEPIASSESEVLLISAQQLVSTESQSANSQLLEVSFTVNDYSNSEIDAHSEQSETTSSQSTLLSSTCSSQTLKHKNGDISFMIPGIPSIMSSENRCCVCMKKVRNRIPFTAILDAFVKRRIHIPPNNRCCKEHFENGRFKDASLLKMKIENKNSFLTGKYVAKWMTLMANHCVRSQRTLDFGGDKQYDDRVYRMMLGVGKDDFEQLHNECKGKFRNSKNRCITVIKELPKEKSKLKYYLT